MLILLSADNSSSLSACLHVGQVKYHLLLRLRAHRIQREHCSLVKRSTLHLTGHLLRRDSYVHDRCWLLALGRAVSRLYEMQTSRYLAKRSVMTTCSTVV